MAEKAPAPQQPQTEKTPAASPPETPQPEQPATTAPHSPGMYSAEDLVVVAQERFGVHPDVVRGAFMQKGATQLTLEEATALVAEYAAYRPPIPGQQEA